MDKIIGLLKELHPEIDVEGNVTLIDQGILDSLDIVTIISELSDMFDVTIPPQEIVKENFNSAEALFAMVTRLQD